MQDHIYVVVRKIDEVHYAEPIYAGKNKQFALTFCNSSFIVLEYDYNGKYVSTYYDRTKKEKSDC